jgi:thiamine-monophosphate kinase
MGEFDLIKRYFTRPARRAVLGVGDDCALWAPTAGQQWAISSDMLVEGRHFVSTVAPERLGHKALAVNLSDLAACGATPRAFTLALALPRVDAGFLEGFARGLFALADAHDIELIGGDTTAGPLNICITVFGEVPPGQALLRSGARAGDAIYVSGSLGDARLALEVLRGALSLPGSGFDAVRLAMEMPQPRLALGQALRGIASSAIDVSDGLSGRPGPHPAPLGRRARACRSTPAAQRAAGGPGAGAAAPVRPVRRRRLRAGVHRAGLGPRCGAGAAAQAGVAVTQVGTIEADPGVRLLDARGQVLPNVYGSFDHFKS